MVEETEVPMGVEEARRHRLARRGDGDPVPLGTFIRWLYTGCRGVILESEMRGGRRIIFAAAIARFNARLSEKPVPKSSEEKLTAAAAVDRQSRVVKQLARKRPRRETLSA